MDQPDPAIIRNPILPGFNPDPSICRAGDDYYIATSTFEWFGGVQIHHSRDLVHWRLHSRALTRTGQLDMRGNPRLCGIWAPCLTFYEGVFYLVYTDVKTMMLGPMGDHPNYLVTTTDPDQGWSQPTFLNASGFDPSLFHDDDGRKWLVNMLSDYRPHKPGMNGIVLQEYDPEKQQLVGPATRIFGGTDLGGTEGPHLYKRDGWYYLLTAEGGTSFGHAVTLARSRKIDGPYEVMPGNPVLTARDNPRLPLQKSGHADLVETQNGAWYMVHLASRPLPSRGRCVLGRETCIQRVDWDGDGWLRLAGGGREPRLEVPAPDLPAHPWDDGYAIQPTRPAPNAVGLAGDDVFRGGTGGVGVAKGTDEGTGAADGASGTNDRATGPARTGVVAGGERLWRDDFDSTELALPWQTLREPLPESVLSLVERPGYLRLRGQGSLASFHTQALVARRQQAFRYMATTALEFDPRMYQHVAGLIAYYDTTNYYYLYMSHDEDLGRVLGILTARNGTHSFPLAAPIAVERVGPIFLQVRVDYDRGRFYFSEDECNWRPIGPEFDAGTLSDDFPPNWGFTGAMIGICAQDLYGRRHPADFDWFEYTER
jgi:xylan 1,4-beta-xylosidase